jgi:photosystem II stability/assembly factor-like uncharacterized protein
VLALVVAPATLLHLAAPAGRAQTAWSSGGPSGGNIVSLAVADGGVLFAAANPGGLFRSANDGRTWAPVVTELLRGVEVSVVAADASGHVYVGLVWLSDANPCQGLLVSSDAGATWACPQLPGRHNIAALTIASDGSVVAASGNDQSLLRSTDHGSTWTATAPPPSPTSARRARRRRC